MNSSYKDRDKGGDVNKTLPTVLIVPNPYMMAFSGAITKVRADKSKGIWEVDFANMADRIGARRERIKKRIDAAKRLTKLMKIQKMMGFKGEEEEELFVKAAASKGKLNTHNIDNNGKEIVSNVQLAGKFLQVDHRKKVLFGIFLTSVFFFY